MLYRENLRSWEQARRVGAGLAVAAYGLIRLSRVPAGCVVAACGVTLAMTGLLDYCPACGMIGRKLDRSQP